MTRHILVQVLYVFWGLRYAGYEQRQRHIIRRYMCHPSSRLSLIVDRYEKAMTMSGRSRRAAWSGASSSTLAMNSVRRVW